MRACRNRHPDLIGLLQPELGPLFPESALGIEFCLTIALLLLAGLGLGPTQLVDFFAQLLSDFGQFLAEVLLHKTEILDFFFSNDTRSGYFMKTCLKILRTIMFY